MGGIISSPIPPKSKIFLNCLTACSPEAPDSLHYTNKAMHSNVDYNPKICNNVCGGQPWERFQLNESPKHMQNFMHVYYPGKPWWQASKKNEIEQLVLYITDGGEMDYHELDYNYDIVAPCKPVEMMKGMEALSPARWSPPANW